jgi:hypothetical protein
VQNQWKPLGRARDCSVNPFGIAKRLKRKARFFASQKRRTEKIGAPHKAYQRASMSKAAKTSETAGTLTVYYRLKNIAPEGKAIALSDYLPFRNFCNGGKQQGSRITL